MNLFTEVDIKKSDFKINYNNKILFVGSCFAENISKFFENAKFNCLINPFGILYNPLSINTMFSRIINNYQFNDNDFFFDGNLYNSYFLHGKFSNSNLNIAISNINNSVIKANNFLSDADYVFITLGTSFVYFLKENNTLVSNCHKQNPNLFFRRKITVDVITDYLSDLIKKLQIFNNKIKIIFTVSPIRHWSDGAHENQLSKSTLLLAIDNVISKCNNCEYFPSYEIVNDQLRDYRFYAEDMIHVSKLAETIIWNKIQETYFDKNVVSQISEVEKFMLAVNHKIQNQNSESTKKFAEKNIKLAKFLMDKISGIDLFNEINYFNNYL